MLPTYLIMQSFQKHLEDSYDVSTVKKKAVNLSLEDLEKVTVHRDLISEIQEGEREVYLLQQPWHQNNSSSVSPKAFRDCRRTLLL